ncbi:LOB domain-containing protein 1 [Hibiscus trionum]|nr:LOB domain-containing protein 1 [Hibiscus trionum]
MEPTPAAPLTTTPTTCSSQSLFPNSSNSPPSPLPPPPVVSSPCAACKILRRRCADTCVLAPYFPPTEPAKFAIAHRVFGASNIIKFLQEIPEDQRSDAVSSMVYEASARIRDPVYGCAGAICHLQRQVDELQAQIAKAQAEVVNMQLQHANVGALLCMEMGQLQSSTQPNSQQSQSVFDDDTFVTSYRQPSFMEDDGDSNSNSLGSLWEPLWS